MTDNALARASACGGTGRAAFDEIVLRYYRRLTMFALGKTGSIQDAEDIAQETFLRAYQNINSFDSSYSLKNWLFTIAYRLIVSGYRKKRPERLSDKAAVQLAVDVPTPEQNQWIWDAARKMGVEAFTVLWLRYKQDMSISAIAQVMKKTKIMVRVLLHRSRVQLAKIIAEKSEIDDQPQWIQGKTFFLERVK